MNPLWAGSNTALAADDPHVDEPVLQIEATQHLAVGLDPILIVDVGALEEGQKVGLAWS